jgi:hypothetical protein
MLSLKAASENSSKALNDKVISSRRSPLCMLSNGTGLL